NRARPQIGERTDCRSRPDLSLSGFNASKVGVLSNHNVVECCIWADRGTGSDRCSTLQLGIWFKSHVLRQLNVYINPGSCRINDSNALAHPALGYATVQFGPERCELYPVVDTLNFHEIIGHICRDTAAFSSSYPQDISQICLALHVIGANFGQRTGQNSPIKGVYTGVNFGDISD